jgi:hypothetical protein
MSTLMIRDLDGVRTLDRREMSAVSGGSGAPIGSGNSWLNGLGPVANVNIAVNQNITQAQLIDVETLNNDGIIGAGFVAPNVNVSPKQWASANAVV